MYKDCYLRFCTQKFTLDTTQQSVHLSNYSIQKYYKNDTERSDELPDENMWTNQEFIDKYLKPINRTEAWEELIYPGMKNAILCSMLSTQDIIEARKNTFELYGADFMIGEDLKPWLIEINCSPTMARATAVTTRLCDSVLEDTCKVIIDKKLNRNCDLGRFELIHKSMTVPQPNYIGIDLKVDGQAYKKLQHQLSSSNSAPTTNSNTSSTNNNNSSPSSQGISKTPISSDAETLTLSGLELKQSRNPLSISSNSPALSNSASKQLNSNSGLKLRKETTLPTISIVNSIHELAQKEQQNMTHLSNYHKTIQSLNNTTGYLLSSNSNDSKLKDTSLNDLSNSLIIKRKSNEDKLASLRPLNGSNKMFQFQQNFTNANIVRPHPFSDLNTSQTATIPALANNRGNLILQLKK